MIRIRLFGAITLEVDGTPVGGLTFKQRQVLALLALADGSPVPRELLADRLWEGEPPRTYVGTLDSYICLLRRAMGASAGRGSALATSDAGFVLSRDVEVDLSWFHRLAQATLSRPGRLPLDWADEALGLVGGDLLAEVPYAAWAARARESFAQTWSQLFTQAARRAIGIGEFDRAASYARLVLTRDPVCETAAEQLMLAHWFAGDRASALAAYGDLRATLAEQLGEQPGREAQDLYLTILRSDPTPAARPRRRHDVDTVRDLLRVLRQELELQGARVPALDAHLSASAAAYLQAHGAGVH